ncbi:hypothetical protein V1286_003659 [Bradyrhizobium algeriense]|jgi:hypothetical protein|uniref:Uncharacterized protein n=1 Tax=Bradyrhizobium algeriense TaxID=634784 RepID=A0ABU8BCD5_9BRAD
MRPAGKGDNPSLRRRSINFSHANGEIFHGMIRCDLLQRIILQQ